MTTEILTTGSGQTIISVDNTLEYSHALALLAGIRAGMPVWVIGAGMATWAIDDEHDHDDD